MKARKGSDGIEIEAIDDLLNSNGVRPGRGGSDARVGDDNVDTSESDGLDLRYGLLFCYGLLWINEGAVLDADQKQTGAVGGREVLEFFVLRSLALWRHRRCQR